jgi:hypothetical protein
MNNQYPYDGAAMPIVVSLPIYSEKDWSSVCRGGGGRGGEGVGVEVEEEEEEEEEEAGAGSGNWGILRGWNGQGPI